MVSKGSYTGKKNPFFGKKHSEETKRKISETKKRLYSEGKIVHPMKGKRTGKPAWNKGLTKKEDKRVLKYSLSQKGKRVSLESIQKMVRTRMKKGSYKHSKEQKRKISKSVKEVLSNQELRKKISESAKKMWDNPDIRKRINEAGKGRTPWNKGKSVPEHSDFLKDYWKNNKHPMLGRKGRIPWNKGKKGAPAWNKGMKFPEISERMRKKILKQYKSGDFPRQTNTKIERLLKEELMKRGYKEGQDFFHQYIFNDKFSCDFCFPQSKLIVEADGDFWHCNPKIYKDGAVHRHQIKTMKKDKAKRAYISKVDNGSWTFLQLWGSEIQKDVVKCVDKIEQSLKN